MLVMPHHGDPRLRKMQVLVLERVAPRYWNTRMMVIVFRIIGAVVRPGPGPVTVAAGRRGPHLLGQRLVDGREARAHVPCAALSLPKPQHLQAQLEASVYVVHCGEHPIWCPCS